MTLAEDYVVNSLPGNMSFSVTNNTTTPFTYSAVSNSSLMVAGPASATLAPNASGTVTLMFNPQFNSGIQTGTVTVSVPGLRSRTVVVTLTGYGATLATDLPVLNLRCAEDACQFRSGRRCRCGTPMRTGQPSAILPPQT